MQDVVEFIPGRAELLPESLVVEAWIKLDNIIHQRLAVRPSTSNAQFLWDALEPYSTLVSKEFIPPIRGIPWAYLFENHPRDGCLIHEPTRETISYAETYLEGLDLCVVPWPRLNWLLMRPHGGVPMAPTFLDLKERPPTNIW